MHADTIAAAQALAQVLLAHPEDVAEARVYGNLPEHLADLIDDQESA